MLRVRSLAIGVVMALALAGCSVDQSPAASARIADHAPAVSADGDAYDQGLYCDALETALLLNPQGGVTDDMTMSDEMTRFADELERAAGFAKASHQQTLLALADMNRNPEDITGDEAFALMPRTLPIFRFAHDECGIDTPGVTVDDDGSVRFSVGGSSDGSSSFSTPDPVSTPQVQPEPIIPSGPGSQPALDLSGAPDARLAALNAGVPDGIDLTFEWQTLDIDDDEEDESFVRFPAPNGWDVELRGLFGAELDGGSAAYGLEMNLDSGCQGSCSAKDWLPTMQDPDRSPFAVPATDDFELLINQELFDPPGRLMVRENAEEDPFGGKVEVILVRWSSEADHFFECEASIPEDVASLWPAFAEVCLLADPQWIS